MVSFILPGNSATGGYDVANSLRFEKTSSDNLSRTSFGTPTLATKFTVSFWFKRTEFGVANYLAGAYDGSSTNSVDWVFTSGDALSFYFGGNAGSGNLIQTNRLFRDASAWYHLVYSVDTTQGTDSNRVKIYINGVQETSFSSATYPAQNATCFLFNSSNNRIADNWNASAAHSFNGYIAEFVHIDGQQLTPTSFGEFDEDSPTIWKPIDVSDLTFGTNGFYLDFEDSSSLGNDAAGSNNFTVNNLTAIDQSTDTCTNNYATLNPLYKQGSPTYSEGNLKVVLAAGDGTQGVASNIAVSQGKWYFEVKQGNATNSSILVREASDKEDDLSYYQGSFASYQFNNGNQGVTGNTSSTYGASYSSGDIIMVALDKDNDRVYFGKNGQWNDGSGNADEANINDYVPLNSVTDAIAAFANANGSATATAEFNFGSPPYSISSGNSDGKGYGNFEYAVPSGYYSINTKNLAEFG